MSAACACKEPEPLDIRTASPDLLWRSSDSTMTGLEALYDSIMKAQDWRRKAQKSLRRTNQRFVYTSIYS